MNLAKIIYKCILADSGFCWAFSLSSMLRHSLNTYLRELKNRGPEKIVKHVGPIWGQYEAEEKVTAFMAKTDLSDCTWTGCWWSENGTSYAQFLGRESNQEKIEAAEKYLNRSDFHKQLRNEF